MNAGKLNLYTRKFFLSALCFPSLSRSHADTRAHIRAHTHSVQMEERGATLFLARCLRKKRERRGRRGKKRSLAVPFPLTQRQAWPKHTGTLSSLLAIHIILSLCPLCEDTNFTTGPSSQPICEKIVVEREGRDTWQRLGLKASLNAGIPPPHFFFCLSEMKDNRVTTLHFSPFAAPQMYSEALYLAERDQLFPLFFFQFNFENQFSPIIAFKSQAEGASPWLVCHVPPPPHH